MSSSEQSYYAGARTFQWLSPIIDLPIDQINFVVCNIVGLIVAVIYRKVLHPKYVSIEVRHTVAMVVGIGLGYFCFGNQISHLVVQSTLAYVIMHVASPDVMHVIVLGVSMLYLSSMHLLRMKYDYGGWTLDITGPLMVATQKVTSVAFSRHDGFIYDSEKLSPEQKRYAIKRNLTLLEYFSYIFQFQSLMCGPLVFYNDYIEFVEGKQYSRYLTTDGKSHVSMSQEPSPSAAVFRKCVCSGFFALFLVVVVPRFPLSYITTEKFLNSESYLSQVWYLLISTSVIRSKYYHAWLLGEAVCNAAGLGFSGYGKDGTPKWDLVTNIDIIRFEISQNLRETLETWNKSTQSWLKVIAYDRAPRHKTLLTYLLSAIWHGFYPGYYLTFLGGAVFTSGGRVVRRTIRPLFQKGRKMSILYDIITCLSTRLIVMYIVIPFVLLELRTSFKVYWNFYFIGHLLCFAAILVLPFIFPRSGSVSRPKSSTVNTAQSP